MEPNAVAQEAGLAALVEYVSNAPNASRYISIYHTTTQTKYSNPPHLHLQHTRNRHTCSCREMLGSNQGRHKAKGNRHYITLCRDRYTRARPCKYGTNNTMEIQTFTYFIGICTAWFECKAAQISHSDSGRTQRACSTIWHQKSESKAYSQSDPQALWPH